jgi:hypothetical protein
MYIIAVTRSKYKEAGQDSILMMKITRKTYALPSVNRIRIYLIVLSIFVVILGGLLALFWQEQQHQIGQAADDSVVGPPSLSATTVDTLFTRLGSPMAGTGKVVEEVSHDTNIDDAFALAVWWAETNDGMAGVGLSYHNPGGVQGSPNYPSNGFAIYPSYAEAVTDWFTIIKDRYVDRGLTSVYSISGPYVGTAGAANWANKVMNSMTDYRALSPVPTPTLKPTPTPSPVAAQTAVPTVAQSKMGAQQNSALLNKSQQEKVTQPVASTQSNADATSTQLLLTGTGLLVAVLLIVPGLLIYRKRRTTGHSWTESLMPRLTLEPEQATNLLPVTTTLRMEAITPQQLKPHYINHLLPILEGEAVNGMTISRLALGNAVVPPTPLQRVPPTPFFGTVPVTPVLPPNSQGGLLTRYSTQSRPRRIELIRPLDTTKQHKIFTHSGKTASAPQANTHTETLQQQQRNEGTEQ